MKYPIVMQNEGKKEKKKEQIYSVKQWHFSTTEQVGNWEMDQLSQCGIMTGVRGK